MTILLVAFYSRILLQLLEMRAYSTLKWPVFVVLVKDRGGVSVKFKCFFVMLVLANNLLIYINMLRRV